MVDHMLKLVTRALCCVASRVVDTDAGRLGIGICYDIRFPEMAMVYAQRGCQLLVYPGGVKHISPGVGTSILEQAE